MAVRGVAFAVALAGLASGASAFAPTAAGSALGLRGVGLHVGGGRWGRVSSRAAAAGRQRLHPVPVAAATMQATNRRQTLITKPRTSHAW